MRTKREIVVVLVLVVVAILLAVGVLYLLLSQMRPPPTASPTPAQWTLDLEPGLSYLAPVSGPTTPLSSDWGGGLWIINANREGRIRMDFARYSLNSSVSPFQVGGISLQLDVRTDFDVAPDPPITGPLDSVFYIVPGPNLTYSSGVADRNGAVAFFAGREFVVASPFTKTVYYHLRLGFDPIWTGEDPASGGQMFVKPREMCVIFGILCIPGGPYRYFWASDGTHTIVFEVSYVHEGSSTQVPSGREMFLNGTLAAPPFVYYIQDAVTAEDGWRSGPGQAIVLPHQNGSLEIANVTGRPRAWIPLTLAGAPAVVTGPIGFVRASYPTRLYLPLRSPTQVGIVALDLSSLSFPFEYLAGDAGQALVATPTSFNGSFLPLAWFSPTNRTTKLMALNYTGAVVPQFAATITGRVQNAFEFREMQKIFVYTEAGGLATLPTFTAGSVIPAPIDFPLRPPSNQSFVGYAGSIAGTVYGSLIPQEVYGVWTDSTSAKCALFALMVPLF